MTTASLPFRWIVLPFALALAACQPPNVDKVNVPLHPDIPDQKVTSANYLSGAKFCEVYSEMTSKEFGKRINVPRKYEGSDGATWSLYAWTPRPFDPKKPSLIYVEGGPGGNSHGWVPFVDSSVNEIRFDQRGLGCSAPETFEDYMDAKLYSSLTTTRDIEELRKAYGIEKVTVLGASYGTVPATMYGHLFPKNARSIILEGVEFTEGDGTMKHRAEKLNQVLEKLTPESLKSFQEFMASDVKETLYIYAIAEYLKMQDNGYIILQTYLETVFSGAKGPPAEVLASTGTKLKEGRKANPYPQGPGSVDGNILTKIFCQELGLKQAYVDFPIYSPREGKYVSYDMGKHAAEKCAEAGVPEMVTDLYSAAKYPMTVPAYYYQGAHDGATPAAGAIKHWRQAAKGSKYFLLKKRGGHGPNITKMVDEKDAGLRLELIGVFKKALRAEKIEADDVSRINRHVKSDERWMLFKSDDENPENELGSL